MPVAVQFEMQNGLAQIERMRSLHSSNKSPNGVKDGNEEGDGDLPSVYKS